MTGTQERAAAAMRAIGDTVIGAPPLHLPPSGESAPSSRLSRRAGPAWRLWLVPAAAALAVIAVAVSLVLVRSAPGESTASLAPAAPGNWGGPGGVPPYYVTLPAFGWYAYAPPSGTGTPGGANTGGLLAIEATATGKQVAIVPAPNDLTFNVVSGAADDRTFVVGAAKSTAIGHATWSESWYLLQLGPGGHPGRLTRLPVPASANVTGVALSPDGAELAVSDQRVSGPSLAPGNGAADVTLWSVATGQEIRHWETPAGQVIATAPATAFTSDALKTEALSTALRWTPDGGQLGFAWNGAQIRLLDLSSPASARSDLVEASTLRAVTGTGYTPGGSRSACNPADGWSLSTGATAFTCAGSYTPASGAIGPGSGRTVPTPGRTVPVPGRSTPAAGVTCPASAPAHPAFLQQVALGGGAREGKVLAQSPACLGADSRGVGASLGWSSADGSAFIGQLSDGTPGYAQTPGGARYGVFANGTFTELPTLPSGQGPVSVAW